VGRTNEDLGENKDGRFGEQSIRPDVCK